MKSTLVKVISTVFLISFIILTGSNVIAENIPTKESIIDSVIKRIQEENNQLGNFQVTMSATNQFKTNQQFNATLEMQLTFNGLKRTGAQFISAGFNGKPISQSQFNQAKERLMAGHNQALGLFKTDFKAIDPTNLYNQCSLDGVDVINTVPVYRLKYVPSGDNERARRIKEVEVCVDQKTFDLIRIEVTGKTADPVQSAQMTIEFQKSLKDYYLPTLIQSQSQIKPNWNGQSLSLQTSGEIKLTNYRAL
ncbi:MAG TPA: hypothetical protein DDW50_03925 [Firmicutes bacterium]|nr:hypothetical protein [Bacillota bacterium]